MEKNWTIFQVKPVIDALEAGEAHFDAHPRAPEVREKHRWPMFDLETEFEAAADVMEYTPSSPDKVSGEVWNYIRCYDAFYILVADVMGKDETAKLLPTNGIHRDHIEMLDGEGLTTLASLFDRALAQAAPQSDLQLKAKRNVDATVAEIARQAASQCTRGSLGGVAATAPVFQQGATTSSKPGI